MVLVVLGGIWHKNFNFPPVGVIGGAGIGIGGTGIGGIGGIEGYLA